MKSMALKYWHEAHPWVLTAQSPTVLKGHQRVAALQLLRNFTRDVFSWVLWVYCFLKKGPCEVVSVSAVGNHQFCMGTRAGYFFVHCFQCNLFHQVNVQMTRLALTLSLQFSSVRSLGSILGFCFCFATS